MHGWAYVVLLKHFEAYTTHTHKHCHVRVWVCVGYDDGVRKYRALCPRWVLWGNQQQQQLVRKIVVYPRTNFQPQPVTDWNVPRKSWPSVDELRRRARGSRKINTPAHNINKRTIYDNLFVYIIIMFWLCLYCVCVYRFLVYSYVANFVIISSITL